jgi:hypothetical protein
VAKDHTVTFEGTLFQIPKQSPYRSYADKRIDVHVLLTAPWSFSTKTKKSLLRLQNDARIWLISNDHEAGRVPPWTSSALSTKTLNRHPDIFTLLLT